MTSIRQYRASDHAAVIALFRGFMRELTPPHLAVEFEAYVETAIRAELGRIEDYYLARPDQGFWVAEENVVLGMVGIERHAADAGELRRLAVDRAHRRRGIGRLLLTTAEAFCREAGYRKVVLSTSELQVAATRLYEANGYRLERKESAAPASHKSVGAGLARYHYEKAMA
jgi:ribosomal protein S18 acetylase RimI-like enzyme